VKSTLASLGLSSVDTIAKFNQVVQGIDLTTDAGQQLYASLMALAPAFYQVEQYQAQQAAAAAALAKQKAQMEITLLQAQGKATEALAAQRKMELAALDPSLRALQQQIYTAQDIASAKDKLAQAYQRERSELEATINKFGDLSKSLRAYRDTLFGGATGGVTYNSALAKLISTGSLASAGDATALGDLPGVGKSFLDVAKDRAGSLQQYQRDVALVARYVDQGIAASDGQASMAQKQLDTMTAQVGKLIDINASVLSVKDAILRAEQAAQAAAPASTPTDFGHGGRHAAYAAASRRADGAASPRLKRSVRAMSAAVDATGGSTAQHRPGAQELGSRRLAAVSTDSDTPLVDDGQRHEDHPPLPDQRRRARLVDHRRGQRRARARRRHDRRRRRRSIGRRRERAAAARRRRGGDDEWARPPSTRSAIPSPSRPPTTTIRSNRSRAARRTPRP
jgi:hypothetical protein